MAKPRSQQTQYVSIWDVHPGPQHQFLMAKEFEVMFGGAKGGGKSDALIIYLIMPPYIHNPKYKGLLIRRTYKRLLELKDRCDFIYKKVDPGCVYNKDEHRYYFSTGATIRLGHCEHEEDKYNYWGHEHQIVAIDQVEELTETQYSILRMCARTSSEGIPPIIRVTANPGVKWVKEYFYDVAPPNEVFRYPVSLPNGETIELTRRFIPATIYDNPTLVKNNPEYVAILASEPNERLRRMHLYGEWDVPENAAFSEFSEKVHVKSIVEMFPNGGRPPEGWMVFATLDWGYSKPFSIHWHTITPMDKIYTFREYYGIQWDSVTSRFKRNVGIKMRAADVAHEFLRKGQDLKVDLVVADASIWDKEGHGTGSIGQEMQMILGESGIPMFPGVRYRGSRATRKMQTHNRLAIAPDGFPWWSVSSNCVHLIRTIKELPINENDIEVIDCLVAGTFISTPDGSIPIENIQEDCLVNTPIGERRILKSGVAGLCDTISISLSDGSKISGTLDHKIYVEGVGLVPLSNIKSGDVLLREDSICIQKLLSSEELVSRSIVTTDIIPVIQVMRNILEPLCCIDSSTKNTLDRFLLDIPSTTGMEMDLTTYMRIWNVCLRHLMQDYTAKEDLKTVGISVNSFQNGEKLTKAKKFCGRMLSSAVRTLQKDNLRAQIVANLLLQNIQQKPIVPIIAKTDITKKRSSVKSVENHSARKTTPTKKSELVVTRVDGNYEKRTVYYLTVEQAHLFYANGILSANTDSEDHAWDDLSLGFAHFPLKLETTASSMSEKILKLDEYRRNIERMRGHSNLPLAYTY